MKNANFAGCVTLSLHVTEYLEYVLKLSAVKAEYKPSIRNLKARLKAADRDIAAQEKSAKVNADMPEYCAMVQKALVALRVKSADLTADLGYQERMMKDAMATVKAEGFKRSDADIAFVKEWDKAHSDEGRVDAIIAFGKAYGVDLTGTEFLETLKRKMFGDKSNQDGLDILARAESEEYDIFTKVRTGSTVLKVMLSAYGNELYALGFIDPSFPTILSAEYDYMQKLRADRKAAKAAKKAAKKAKYGKKQNGKKADK